MWGALQACWVGRCRAEMTGALQRGGQSRVLAPNAGPDFAAAPARHAVLATCHSLGSDLSRPLSVVLVSSLPATMSRF